MGSKSLRSVGADLGNRAEAEVEGPAGAEAWPEMAEKLVKWVPSYEKEDISASDSDSSNMTSSFNMVGGVSKMLRSKENDKVELQTNFKWVSNWIKSVQNGSKIMGQNSMVGGVSKMLRSKSMKKLRFKLMP